MSFIIIIALFAIAWIVLILPKQREVRRHNALVSSIETGDEVMTGSGIYGTVVQVDQDTVLLQIAPQTEIKVARRAIAAKVEQPSIDMPGDDDHDASDDSSDDAEDDA